MRNEYALQRTAVLRIFSANLNIEYVPSRTARADVNSTGYSTKHIFYYINMFILLRHSYDLPLPSNGNTKGFVQYAGWGNRGSQLIVVWNNNLYYYNSINSQPVQLTNDGEYNMDSVLRSGRIKKLKLLCCSR